MSNIPCTIRVDPTDPSLKQSDVLLLCKYIFNYRCTAIKNYGENGSIVELEYTPNKTHLTTKLERYPLSFGYLNGLNEEEGNRLMELNKKYKFLINVGAQSSNKKTAKRITGQLSSQPKKKQKIKKDDETPSEQPSYPTELNDSDDDVFQQITD